MLILCGAGAEIVVSSTWRIKEEQHEQLKMLVSNNLFWTVPNVTTLATFSHAVHLLFYLSSVHQHDLTTATVCSDSSALDYRQC